MAVITTTVLRLPLYDLMHNILFDARWLVPINTVKKLRIAVMMTTS